MSDAAALMVVRGGDFLAAFDKPQRDALAMLFLNLRDHQDTAAEILWGVWLFPLALLVYRSRFLPRFLGVWLAIGGFAYVILSLTGELLPRYQEKVFTYSRPAFFGELLIMLLARDQGCQAASGRDGFIVGGWREPIDLAPHA